MGNKTKQSDKRCRLKAWNALKTYIVIILMLSACGEKPSNRTAPRTRKAPNEVSLEAVQCPVCGLSFPKDKKAKSYNYLGKEYHFYIEDHFLEFKKNPQKYISGK